MNLFGKILIVLILVMSLVFMGLAIAVFSTHRNWEELVTSTETMPGTQLPKGLQPRMQRMKAEYENLQATYSKIQKDLTDEKSALTLRLQQAESALNQVTGERDALQNQEDDLRQKNSNLVAEVKTAHDELTAREKEVMSLRDDISKTQEDRDELFNSLVAKTDDLNASTIELQRLKDTNLKLTARTSDMREMLDKLGENGKSADGIPPNVDGIVLASSDEGLVEISLGSDEGLEEGHQLVVTRDSAGTKRFVGKIEIVKTEPDRSVAKVIPEFMKAPIEIDDRVATRIN